ncbi:hypothetical protein [Methylobacterium sp. 1030]|uniref:hypothetical protein n=1 Tax=Methylobacterium sp. 1030 TaxID=3156404 RepID=UPI003392453A
MTVQDYLDGPSGPFEAWVYEHPADTLVAVTCDDGDVLVKVARFTFGEQVVFETTHLAHREPVLPPGTIADWAALNGVPCVACPTGGAFALMPETDAQRLVEKMRWR